MVDLKSQYNTIKTEIDYAIQNVLNTTTYINGPEVKEFQKELENYLHIKHVIPCANGTDALQIAMMALDLKPDDEVITSNFTFAATVEVIALLKLTPVLVDVYPDTFNINIEAVKKAITPKTKAIVPVHLFGQCADMEPLIQLAKENNLQIIEDNAQAIGADYTFADGTKKKAGTMGIVGTTSFFPSKNLGCYGDGGAIFTNDDALAQKLRSIANHGMTQRYYYESIGVNSRLDSIQAAILRVKLPHLDSYCEARRKAAEFYNRAFSHHPYIITPTISDFSTHVFHQYTVRIINADRNAMHHYLLENDIPNAIYYPVPLHTQKAYRDTRFKDDDFPITNELVESVISLPMHTEFNKEQLAYITQKVLAFFTK